MAGEKTKPKSQRQAFIEAARKTECDESEGTWKAKLKRIAKASPKIDTKIGRKDG